MPRDQSVQSNHPPLLLFSLVKAENSWPTQSSFILKCCDQFVHQIAQHLSRNVGLEKRSIFKQQRHSSGRLAFRKLYKKILLKWGVLHTHTATFTIKASTVGWFHTEKREGEKRIRIRFYYGLVCVQKIPVNKCGVYYTVSKTASTKKAKKTILYIYIWTMCAIWEDCSKITCLLVKKDPLNSSASECVRVLVHISLWAPFWA